MRSQIRMISSDSDDIISLAWTVDLDSKDSVRSSGITRGLTIDEYDVTTRDWYIEAMEAQDFIITEPYIDTLSQTLVTSVIGPAYDTDGSMLGLVAIDITLSNIKSIMSKYNIGNNGVFFLTTEGGTMMYHPDESKLTLPMEEAGFTGGIVSNVVAGKTGKTSYVYDKSSCLGSITKIGTTGWNIISGVSKTEVYGKMLSICVSMLVLLAIACAALVFVVSRIASSLTKPIMELKNVANEIADGNLDVSISVSSQDEIGLVAEAMQKTVHRLKDYMAYIDEISEILESLEQGNLYIDLKQSYGGQFQKIKIPLEAFTDRLREIILGIQSASTQVAEGSKQVSDGAQVLAEEAGRGFAVVASEVSNLAQKSTEASEIYFPLSQRNLRGSRNWCGSCKRKCHDSEFCCRKIQRSV